MKNIKKFGINTICAHVGEVKDEQFKGAVSPIYMSTSYAFEGVDIKEVFGFEPTAFQDAIEETFLDERYSHVVLKPYL